ncbi:MAG: thioredoxin fold domain-containing protein [Cyanobacteria bacterium CRU_2_1]|nr:thioredoxin fold domain-containing protein [Cyanobacteria bacterium RU_5_0]NJR58338.1 thioredoxin fold domain-containing protein [Cyanobacteria bacterium CRU_2_1]
MTVNPTDSKPQSTPQPTQSSTTTFATRLRNFVIVLVAVALSAAIFFGLRSGSNTASLATMAETSIPLEVALSNEKPTLMEFYADWCTACQAMAKDMSELKQQYDSEVNFVMLNVDNSKWLPEMLHYRVDGIPHFVFLNAEGKAIASTLGEQPRIIMATNLEALITGSPLPYAQAKGRISEVDIPIAPKANPDDPRSHGSQVVTQ